jgi:hypothetical protein
MTAARPLALVGPDRHRRERERERKARYRVRLDRKMIVVPVEVTHDVIAMLLDLNWLELAKSENRSEIGSAITRLLADSAKADR